MSRRRCRVGRLSPAVRHSLSRLAAAVRNNSSAPCTKAPEEIDRLRLGQLAVAPLIVPLRFTPGVSRLFSALRFTFHCCLAPNAYLSFTRDRHENFYRWQ